MQIELNYTQSHTLATTHLRNHGHTHTCAWAHTCRLAQNPISRGMYLSLLLWHARVLSCVSSPISDGKSDSLFQILYVAACTYVCVWSCAFARFLFVGGTLKQRQGVL